MMYDMSPIEIEIHIVSEMLPKTEWTTLVDERLVFWSLVMLADCGVNYMAV